jgi:hypothetical protein
VIATANDRDRINDLSSALKRRFSTVVLPCLPPLRRK